MGKLNLSFMAGERNIVGLLGEEIYSIHAPKSELHDLYDYDFTINERKVDVKTRILTHPPKPEYEMAILLTRPDQDVDFYVFCGVHDSFAYGWLIGWLSKKDFLEKSKFIEAGSPMPQGGKYRSNSHVINIKDMNEVKR